MRKSNMYNRKYVYRNKSVINSILNSVARYSENLIYTKLQQGRPERFKLTRRMFIVDIYIYVTVVDSLTLIGDKIKRKCA